MINIALTIKQKAFVDDYIITMNATESYLKFYKNVKNRETARANSSRLLNTPEVKEYIENRMKILDEELIADQREILRSLTRQARREEVDYQISYIEKASYDENGNFLGMERKPEIVKLPTQNRDAIKALELLGKRYGIWTDRVEMQTENVVIIDDI